MSLADDFDSIDAAPKKGAAPAASSSAKPAASAAPSSLADQFDATPTTAAAKLADKPTVPQQSDGATWAGGEIGRQLGLTARAAGHGLADAVDLVGAPLNAVANLFKGVHLHNPGDAIRSGVDAITPAPQNALERVVNSGASAMAGAAGGAGMAGRVASAATNPLTQAIAAQMAAAPAAQIAAGAGAGTASQGAQEAGAGPVAQMGAGLLGGVAGGVAGAGVAAGANRLAGILSAAKPAAPAARVEPSTIQPSAPVAPPQSSKPAMPVTVSPNEAGSYITAQSDAGSVGASVKDGAIYINHADVSPDMQGKGHGKALYSALIDHALDNGLRVFSDSTVEMPAVRVYDALGKSGYQVNKMVAGTLEASDDLPHGAVYGKGAESPAFEVVSKPATPNA